MLLKKSLFVVRAKTFGFGQRKLAWSGAIGSPLPPLTSHFALG
jgi:hypothetical protein